MAADETAILEGARHVLGELAEMELLLKSSGQQVEGLTEELAQLRQGLRENVRYAFQAYKNNQAGEQRKALAWEVEFPEPRQVEPVFRNALGPPGLGGRVVSRGEDIRRLQELLRGKGLSVVISGDFDRYTSAAVRKFQEQYGIRPANGVVGSETRRVLNALANRARPGCDTAPTERPTT